MDDSINTGVVQNLSAPGGLKDRQQQRHSTIGMPTIRINLPEDTLEKKLKHFIRSVPVMDGVIHSVPWPIAWGFSVLEAVSGPTKYTPNTELVRHLIEVRCSVGEGVSYEATKTAVRDLDRWMAGQPLETHLDLFTWAAEIDLVPHYAVAVDGCEKASPPDLMILYEDILNKWVPRGCPLSVVLGYDGIGIEA